MRYAFVVAFVSVVAVPASSARADDAGATGHADAGACKAPNHDRAIEMQRVLNRLMKVASGPLDAEESLDTFKSLPEDVRESVAVVRCDEPALSPRELADAHAFEARATKWADDQDKRLAAEENARTAIIVPLCQAIWGLESARAEMAHEKANPSGVVDLVKLHSLGEAVQYWQPIVDALKPQYAAFRRHPFTRWQAEGACVAETKKPGN